MILLAFDWKGFFAHFRQFDTNSSSLSHAVPPPTVIAGLLAGVLGLERDSYYDLFQDERLTMGVQVRTKIRKIMQTVNYAKIKQRSDLFRSLDDEHTQIPMELVVAESFPREGLHYRIYLGIWDEALAQFLQDALQSGSFSHVPYMGSAPFLSWLEWPGRVELLEEIPPHTETTVEGVVDLHLIEPGTLRLEPVEGQHPAIFREHVRRAFLPGREPGPVTDLLWERNTDKIRATFGVPVYRVRVGQAESTVLLY